MRFTIGKSLVLAAASLWLGVATVHAHEPWMTLTDCRYVPNLSNDGDSFHARVGRKEYIFRLYFVDAAETDTGLSERTEEQAQYFGITDELTLKVGEAAKEFTRKKLQQPFTVRTCRQDALGRSKLERFYAFVQVGKKDLGEELVANGLARLHGTASQAPGLDSPEREWEKLRRLEREARTQKVGGWGAMYGRLNAQVRTAPEKPEDSFEAFFHPRRVAVAPISTPQPLDNNSGAKLDVNAATADELDHLPGIGAVLAARIIAARPFKSADDLRRVKGIGAKKYVKLRPHFN
ncbi:MAG: helix-hairpin-helix domain-containing protein [Verrucomicrobiota bacterium]